MEFLTSPILSGVIFDLIRSGVRLNVNNVFAAYNNQMDYHTCEEFLDKINAVEGRKEKMECAAGLLREKNKYTTLFEYRMYPTNFAKRLDYVLLLMNDCGLEEAKINVERLGEYLGFKSVNDLKQYYLNHREPDYELIERIAGRLGLSAVWLKFGQGEPFVSSLRHCNPVEIPKLPEFDSISEFVFVTEEGKQRRNLGILVKMDKLKYSYYPRTYVFHANVGVNGAAELMQVYSFLEELNRQEKMPSNLCQVSEKTFEDYFTGRIYPGSIKKYRQNQYNCTLEDFITLYRTPRQKERYRSLYGDVFVDCQSIIKERLAN